jgi:hypothetical protein
MSNRNRTAGHNWERKVVKDLRQFFPNVVTSRSESRNLDNLKVDIAFTDPFIFQCKTTASNIDLTHFIKEMPNNGFRVLAVQKTKKKNERFYEQGKMIVFEYDDFFEFFKTCYMRGLNDSIDRR